MALCDIHVAGCGEHLPAWGLRAAAAGAEATTGARTRPATGQGATGPKSRCAGPVYAGRGLRAAPGARLPMVSGDEPRGRHVLRERPHGACRARDLPTCEWGPVHVAPRDTRAGAGGAAGGRSGHAGLAGDGQRRPRRRARSASGSGGMRRHDANQRRRWQTRR